MCCWRRRLKSRPVTGALRISCAAVSDLRLHREYIRPLLIVWWPRGDALRPWEGTSATGTAVAGFGGLDLRLYENTHSPTRVGPQWAADMGVLMRSPGQRLNGTGTVPVGTQANDRIDFGGSTGYASYPGDVFRFPKREVTCELQIGCWECKNFDRGFSNRKPIVRGEMRHCCVGDFGGYQNVTGLRAMKIWV